VDRKPSQEGRRTRENHEVDVSGIGRGRRDVRAGGFLGAIAAAGLLLIALYGAGLVSTAWLVTVPTTLFLFVYFAAMAGAVVVSRREDGCHRGRGRGHRDARLLRLAAGDPGRRCRGRRRARSLLRSLASRG
jgi:hypothetical protein